MLLVGLHDVHQGPVETSGQVAADDPVFEGLAFRLARPVEVRGRLVAAGAGSYFWSGTLATLVDARCRRCLAPLAIPLDVRTSALFTAEAEADDPAAYPLPPRARTLDLGPMVREELILAVPAYPVCREDCRGICPRCGTDLNLGPCRCTPERDARWGALSVLLEQPDDSRKP